jgi:hypothetical protein
MQKPLSAPQEPSSLPLDSAKAVEAEIDRLQKHLAQVRQHERAVQPSGGMGSCNMVWIALAACLACLLFTFYILLRTG